MVLTVVGNKLVHSKRVTCTFKQQKPRDTFFKSLI